MGQYWQPFIEKPEGMYTVSAHQFGSGLKIMEHSYIGNSVPSIVMWNIYKEPGRVSWVGDYCETRKVGKDLYGPTGDELYNNKNIITYVNDSERPDYVSKIDNNVRIIGDYTLGKVKQIFGHKYIGRYILVNHDRKEYLSFEEYMKIPKDPKSYILKYDLIISPLSLLTAAPSMGEGGGDYWEESATNYDKVGTWSWDRISVEDAGDVPFTYTKVNTAEYYFDEINRDDK